MKIKYFKILIFCLCSLILLSACNSQSKIDQQSEDVSVPSITASTPQSIVESSQESPRQLFATGIGQVIVTPDMAYIYIGVQNQDPILADAIDENSTTSDAVIKAIKGLGIKATDIQTSSFNVYKQSQYFNNGEMYDEIYNVDNTVYITVRDRKLINDVLDASIKAGANNINGIQFDLADKTTAISEARKFAIENANLEAKEVASLSGVELLEIANVSTYVNTNNGMPSVFDGRSGGGGNQLNISPIPISAGQMVISVTASLTYNIK